MLPALHAARGVSAIRVCSHGQSMPAASRCQQQDVADLGAMQMHAELHSVFLEQPPPRLSCAAGGIDDVTDFTDSLIEEPDAMFSSNNRQAMVGLVAFLEQVKFEVHQFIEHKM